VNEKHSNIAYVARSEVSQMTQIVFVFEDRIEFEVAAE
jgi:hypothetical protein